MIRDVQLQERQTSMPNVNITDQLLAVERRLGRMESRMVCVNCISPNKPSRRNKRSPVFLTHVLKILTLKNSENG